MLQSTFAITILTATASIVAAQDGDWSSNWDTSRTLLSAFDVDPQDPRSMMRGSGDVEIGGGIAKFFGNPRLYISHDDPSVEGWENVEITAYGKYVNRGVSKSYSGLTFATRSNHDEYASNGCSAFGYYARIYENTGECAIQKEYFHGNSNDPIYVGTVYSNSKRVDCFPGGLPMNEWVGLKFKVNTVPDTSDVLLELWVDYNNDGLWELGISYTDTVGDWPCSTSKVVPTECSQNNGDTVTRPGNVSFLRTDGEDTTTEVHWRDVTITNSVTPKPLCSDGIEGSNGGTEVCCASSCGQCGGSGCGSLPGGSSLCCTGSIITNGQLCQDSSDVGCIISSPTTSTTVASTTTQAITTQTTTTTQACVDDPDWRHTTNKGREKSCAWVAKKNTSTRCTKEGDDGRLAQEACECICAPYAPF